MRIERLQLKDFRGFRELDLHFPAAGPAVLIGANGAGKSSVLDAVAMFLARFVALAKSPGQKQPSFAISPRDVRHGATTAFASIVFAIGGAQEHVVEEIREAGSRVRSLSQLMAELENYVSGLVHALSVEKNASLPVLCHYRPNRGIGTGKATTKQRALKWMLPPQLRAYDRAFGRSVGPFQYFVRWFRFEEDAENEVRLRKDSAHRSKRLEAVRQAALGTMNALAPGDFTNLRAERPTSEESVDFSIPEEASLLVDKRGERLALDQLSDGEKTTLLLVADLAMRLAIANPGLEDPLRGKGIVLIDELELHLDPKWQRAILPGLCATFPGCQFIVTTHSPQVLSTTHKESVLILEGFRVVDISPPTYGRDSNGILRDAMGTPPRPLDTANELERIAKLIDAEEYEAAQSALDELSNTLGELDPEIVRLRTLAHFLEG